MDIFRFTNPTNPLKMESGRLINGLKSKMWIERYDLAGEFKLVADASLGLRKLLPIGSFISHVDTPEIMVVENHEITEVKDQNSEIVITGRGFESIFEQRVIGADGSPVTYLKQFEFSHPVDPDYLHNQIVRIIREQTMPWFLYDDNNTLSYLGILTQIPDGGEMVARDIKQQELYAMVKELLMSGNLGIKVVRPGPSSPFLLPPGSPGTPPDSSYTAVMIHKGVDRSNSIIFSTDTGEIESADYLWSNKSLKNAILLVGKWLNTAIVPTEVEYARRWTILDVSDIDQGYTHDDIATNITLYNQIEADMQQRGRDALARQNDVALTKAEVSQNTRKAAYRKDFDLGDIITVNGDYNESSKMRVTEYVEIEDENGMSGHPTLTVL